MRIFPSERMAPDTRRFKNEMISLVGMTIHIRVFEDVFIRENGSRYKSI